jgi:Domain of Unknown Function (DUF1259)
VVEWVGVKKRGEPGDVIEIVWAPQRGDTVPRLGNDEIREIREGTHVKIRPATASKGRFMRGTLANLQIGILITSFSTVLTAQVSLQVRASIDQILGGQGAFTQDGKVYKVVFPRSEATIVYDYQTLSPNLGLNSWVALKPGVHNEALLVGRLLLLDDEVDSVISAALEARLDVTGLASSTVFDGPHLQTLDVTATGTFQDLAASFRKCLDEIQQVRRARAEGRPNNIAPDTPVESSIDPAPLDAVLAMKGVVIGGAYRAAVGAHTLLRGEDLGGEMGMSTWVSVAGTNDHAIAHGEFVAGTDDLQRVLKALRVKGISVTSIRNHILGEEPQFVFVHFRGEGTALDLARAVRYVSTPRSMRAKPRPKIRLRTTRRLRMHEPRALSLTGPPQP